MYIANETTQILEENKSSYQEKDPFEQGKDQ